MEKQLMNCNCRVLLLVVLVMMLSVVFRPNLWAANINWVKQGMVLDIGINGEFDDVNTSVPTVILDGSTYKMWYGGYDGATYRIGYATSTDGIAWTKQGMVLDIGANGAFDDVQANRPFVILDGSTYKMWYQGYDGANYRIGYATSIDGIVWTKQGVVLDIGATGEFDSVFVAGAMVMLDGLTYKIWYHGYDGTHWRTGYATSSDGISWTKQGVVLDIGASGEFDDMHAHNPTVTLDGSTYKMWYAGNDGVNDKIGYATSIDGISWTKQGIGLNSGAAGEFDDEDVHNPTVIMDGTEYKMWYTGYDGTNQRIGYATAVVQDCVAQDWVKQGMVLDIGINGEFDDVNTSVPTVILDGSTYKMWYGGYDGATYRIGYATSTDGIAWTKQGMVLDIGANGAFDDVQANRPFVILDGSTYKMWYQGYDGANYRIGYATSIDGIVWTKQGVVLDIGATGEFDSVFAAGAMVMLDGLTYKIWYHGYDGTHWRTGYATSSDGISWTKQGVVLDIGASGEFDDMHAHNPTVILDGSTYKMWYAGNDGVNDKIGYATSIDGISWTKQCIVLNSGAAGEFDDEDVHNPTVIMDGTEYKMWYTGYDGANQRIGYATAFRTEYKMWYTGYDGANQRIGYATAVTQDCVAQDWVKQGMVLDIGINGEFDDVNTSVPTVILDGSTYKMWYGGYDGATYRIGYATSTDGIAWTRQGMVLDIGANGEFDDVQANRPFVILDGSTYKMWYQGYDGANYRIGYATSIDGIVWTKQGVVLDIGATGEFDSVFVAGAMVMLDGLTYKIWYHGYDGTHWRTGYATSSDGISWTKQGVVLDIGASGEFDDMHAHNPTVILDGSTYKMWYAGNDGVNDKIGYATSIDGISWTKQGIGLNSGAAGEFDDEDVHNPTVIMDGTEYKMWYTGYDGTNQRIGYATAVVQDCVAQDWVKQGMVLDIGINGEFDDVNTSVPTVILGGSTYKMWYGGYDGATYRIGYATSTDGIAWTKQGMVLDIGANGAFDDVQANRPFVILDGSTYKMWYQGYDGANYRIGYATSIDGIVWTKQGVVLDIGATGEFDSVFAAGAMVMLDGLTYKIWYHGYDGTHWRTGYATSSDGISWTKQGVVLDIGASGEFDDMHAHNPTVILDGSTYKMWYAGNDGVNDKIGYATSIDGISWTKQGIVLNSGAAGEFDDEDVHNPTVIMTWR